jgi:glycerol-3-phosphate dehydrogenase
LLDRWSRTYGTRLERWLGDARGPAELGREIAGGLYEAELEYLRQQEWAVAATDVLWRRTKLGLHLPADAVDAVDAWFAAR